MSEKPSFFAELKRRNVYKVAVAYAVVAWLLMQIASQIFPFFEIPNWTVRLVVLLLIIGFPIAVIIAWAFELTPEGLKRTEVADTTSAPHSAHRTWIYLVLIAGVLSIGLFFLARYTVSKPATAGSQPAKSIAVLPFENLSHDPDNAYFADGIQDEILSTVGKIGDLKVISRTSTAKYKSRPENLRQVATELGAANVLEGSVQKSGERARIIVQLIDAQTDAHLWSETYDRELKDIFSVESEVAQSIAGALKAKLTPETAQSLDQVPTRDPEAYQAYLKAGYFVREATSRNGDPATLLPQALQLYGEAVTRDPSFARAWAQISYTHSWMHWFSVDDSPIQVRLADEAAQRAVTIDPQLGEAHLALAYVAYWGRRDYPAAMGELELARKALPNNSTVALAIASIHRRRGEWDASYNEFRRAASLDPRDAGLLSDTAYALALSRRYTEALEAMDRSLTIQPDYWDALSGSAMIEIASRGDTAKATALVARLPANVDPQGQVRYGRWRIAMWSRDFLKAIAALDDAPDWVRSNPIHRPVPSAALRGITLEARGQIEAARREFERAVPLLEEKIKSGAGEPAIYTMLGRAYAGLGRADDAVREGKRGVELLPVSKDTFNGTFHLEQLAEIHARLGNVDEALSIIRQLLDMPAGLVMSPALLRLDPVWDPIRNDPRFQKLITLGSP